MEYILNEEEFLIFKESREIQDGYDKKSAAIEAARGELLTSANYTCVHDREDRYEGYCNDCPCSPIAGGHNYQTWNLICGRTQHYSQ